MRTILAISQDQGLLASRAAVLRKTNADVIEAKASEAENILRAHQCDLVVLCHSLTPAQTFEIASLAISRQSQYRYLTCFEHRVCFGVDIDRAGRLDFM
jgi:DNA-binding response OmpR family regulator